LFGAPQPADIIKANARDIVLSMKNVSKDVLPLFKEISEELAEELGTTDALSRALALICGCTEKVKQRSLLCSIEGFITYTVETDNEFRSTSYVWGFLKRHFDVEVTEAIKGMRSFKNHLGAAFDVPEKYGAMFEKFIEGTTDHKGYELKKAESLPEFEEEAGSRGGSNFNNYNSYNNPQMEQNGHSSYNTGNSQMEPNPRGGRGGGSGNNKARDERKCFVGGLSFDSTEDDLKAFFKDEKFSPEEVIILKDSSTGRSKGVGFILFSDKETAEKATKLSGKKLQSRSLRINMAGDKPGR